MRDGWTETTLGDAVDFCRSRIDPLALNPNEILRHWSIPVLDETGGPRDEPAKDIGSHKFRVKENSVVFSLLNPRIPRFALVVGGDNVVCSTEFAVMKPGLGITEEFLLVLASSDVFHGIVNSLANGTTKSRERVKSSDLENVSVLMPPLVQQKRIVDVVSSVDTYIGALQQEVVTARAARKAVLHELLSTSGDGWSECGLGDIAEVLDRMRKPISGAEREKRIGDVPYYGATGQAGWIDKPIFDEELVLLGEDAIDFLNPDVHKAYLISGPSWVNNHAHVLRANREKVLSFFLMEALNAVDYSQFVAFGTRSKLTQGSMMGISVQVPPLVEQKRIVEIVSSMDEVIQSTEQAVVDAKNLRSGLLSDLLSGEHEIPASYDSLLGAA